MQIDTHSVAAPNSPTRRAARPHAARRSTGWWRAGTGEGGRRASCGHFSIAPRLFLGGKPEPRGARSAVGGTFPGLAVHADFLKLGRFRSGFLGFAQGSRDFFPVLGDRRNLGAETILTLILGRDIYIGTY
jgi:hypothetical protein